MQTEARLSKENFLSWDDYYQNISVLTFAFLSLLPLQHLVLSSSLLEMYELLYLNPEVFGNLQLPSMPVKFTIHILLAKHPKSLKHVLWIYITLYFLSSVNLHYVYTLLY